MEYEYVLNEIGMQYDKYDKSNMNHALAHLDYNNVRKNELKIEYISSDTENHHHSTDLIVNFIKFKQNHSIIYKRIHGRFSSTDTMKGHWSKSIPFFHDLSTYISKETGLKYSFHLYYDLHRVTEITDCFTNNCIDLLTNEHLINNSDMAFDLILKK